MSQTHQRSGWLPSLPALSTSKSSKAVQLLGQSESDHQNVLFQSLPLGPHLPFRMEGHIFVCFLGATVPTQGYLQRLCGLLIWGCVCLPPRSAATLKVGLLQNCRHSAEDKGKMTVGSKGLQHSAKWLIKSVCSEVKNSWGLICGSPLPPSGVETRKLGKICDLPQTTWQRSDSNPAHGTPCPLLSLHHNTLPTFPFYYQNFPLPFFF